MIVVIDTNVWVSALRFGGAVAQQVDRVLADEGIAIAMSPQLVAELNRVLVDKFKLDAQQWLDVEAYLDVHTYSVVPSGDVPLLCRDPADNHVLHLCRATQAGLLVTGDTDLLVLDPFEVTRICRPASLPIYLP